MKMLHFYKVLLIKMNNDQRVRLPANNRTELRERESSGVENIKL